MRFLKKLLSLFNRHKDTAQDLVEQHGDKLDAVTDKIPGETDDKLVDQAREMLKK